jgi:osmotically-inducible protein OsmY
MTNLSRKFTLAAGLTLALVASAGVACADSVSQDIVDARQERQIWTTYALSPHLRATNLVALVQSGRVRLTGTVAENEQKDLAAVIAAEVTGIHEVDNQIVVQPGYVFISKTPARSYGEVIDDASVTFEVESKIAWSKFTQDLHAMVDTTRGTVRLRGTADSQAAKNLAGRLAETTRNVVMVDNQLTVTGVRSPALENDTLRPSAPGQNVSDSWITAKVASTLLYSINASAGKISVSTIGGVVTLTGRAKSSVERALAIDLAQNVRGVRSVSSQGYTF